MKKSAKKKDAASKAKPRDLEQCRTVELSVGDATLAFTPQEAAGIIAELAR